MKIAVYTIAKDEEKFVERWAESCKEADYRLIVDTGSTDNTLLKAAAMGVDVASISISPWRFDDARNAALALLPDDVDYCISLDMDEILAPGWRPPLEEAFKKGITRPKYKHVWSWKDDGTPAVEFAYDHIHTRKNYRWKHPVHECLYVYGMEEVSAFIKGVETHHHPDMNKSRSQYLPLLEMSVKEDPNNDRNSYYYARELFFNGQLQEAGKEFNRHLSLPSAVWKPERAASYRYLAKCFPEKAAEYLHQAVAEAPGRREAAVELASHYYSEQNWEKCMEFSFMAISIAEKPLDYLCEEFAWGPLPWDLAALAAYNLGSKEEAVQYGTKAVELAPADQRIARNLEFYQAN